MKVLKVIWNLWSITLTYFFMIGIVCICQHKGFKDYWKHTCEYYDEMTK